jgi:hypothetical protein
MLNELSRWVDPRVKTLRVAEVQAYLRQHGWSHRPGSRPQQLVFEKPAAASGEAAVVAVPASEQFPDYPQRILEVVTELAEIEDRYAVDVLNDILRAQTPPEPNGAARDASSATGARAN